MGKTIAGIMTIFLMLESCCPVLAGDWTAHGFIYKPSLGARGTEEKNRYDSSLDRVDARLSKEIWVGDPNYGTTIQDALTAISGTQAILRIPAGTHSISANLIVPSNVSLRVERLATLAIPQGVTLAINGSLDAGPYKIFSCTGTGKVVFGRPNGVKELVPQWWGAKADGATDDIIPLQAMADCSVASGGIPMFCPGGVYKITDTLKLNKGEDYYTFAFRGAGAIPASGGIRGTFFDAASFGDRPAINVQGARHAVLENFCVMGKNVAPVAASNNGGTWIPDSTLANWITAGCNDTQFAPYVGMSIDAYQGIKPAGGYSNDDYGRYDTLYTTLRNVVIQGFVVGLGVGLHNTVQDDAGITVESCLMQYNTYGYSSGNSQARSTVFLNSHLEGNWCCVTTTRHGRQEGNCPQFFGGILDLAWKIYEISATTNASVVSGTHIEGFCWLGEFGDAVSGGSEPMVFNGVKMSFNGPTGVGNAYEPLMFFATKPINFNACEFNMYGLQHFNFLNYNAPVKFTSCAWRYLADTINVPFGINYQLYNSTNVFYEGCNVESAAYTDSGYNLSIDCEFRDYSGYVTRRFIGPFTHTARIWNDNGGFTNYKVSLPAATTSNYARPQMSGASVTGVGHNAVLTFTASNAGDWKLGDIILSEIHTRSGTWSTQVPAFKVTNIAGTTITATSFVEGVTVSSAYWTPRWYVNVFRPLFINATGSTGDTHSNTTVDNVTTIANWKIGDWITGTGLPIDTRIVNIVGTTITLSKAATATAAGVALYNCKLTAY